MDSADRAALEALFRSTDGENWKLNSNWVTDAELSTWHGIKVGEDGRVLELSLRRNNLRGPIPEALGSLTNLETLYLSINQLTGPIPEALSSLTNLETLYLNINQLTGPIPEALGSLTNLETLFLKTNQLTGPISEALSSLTNLENLSLFNNQLTGPIPEALSSLTNLENLSVSNNQLTGPIPEALSSLTNLENLSLSNNQLTGIVPLSVWKLPTIKHLNLAGNRLTHFTDPEEKNASTRVVLDRLASRGVWRTAGNPWEFPPAAVVANGVESIRKYYDTWEQCDFSLAEIHALKVVLVGACGAGKTSLARSIKMGRGDRTPEVDEDKRTTVGVDLHSHTLRNGTECKIYDVAGQITYYGLHQFFLTERAVYVIVWDSTKFEGLSGKELDEAIEDNIMEWVSLLHMRTPLCTVMLVASHYDMLHGTPEENDRLLATVEKRFLEKHEDWKSLRDNRNSSIDGRMTVLSGVFAVSCRLATESASGTAADGLQAVNEALSRQQSVASCVPQSWVAARQVLDEMGSADSDISGDTAAVDRCRRPWELRSVVHDKFKRFVEECSRNAAEGDGVSYLSRLREDGIRDAMDGAIELRAFSGTVISHDIFVVLDVMWLAGVLKPILDHRGVSTNRKGEWVFANREITSLTLRAKAEELIRLGILRRDFARFLWKIEKHDTQGVDDSHVMEPVKFFEEILEGVGVAIPLPEPSTSPAVYEDIESNIPATAETRVHGDGDAGSRRDGVDLLVIMRLPEEADAETRENLLKARKDAFSPPFSSGGDHGSLKAVFEFDHGGAPHGLPERVMALSHKIGILSAATRWRLGGHFILGDNKVGSSSSILLEYDKKSKTLSIEALGHTPQDIEALRFVISALYHVARNFPGASWMGWIVGSMGDDEEKMYHLAMSHEKQDQEPGSRIIPLIKDSRTDMWREQDNLYNSRRIATGGPYTKEPTVFGRVLDVRQPYPPEEVPDPTRDEERKSGCRNVYDEVLQPRSGKIATFSLSSAIGFFVAATAVDDAKRATLGICYGFAALCLLGAVTAAVVFAKDKVAEGLKRDQESDGDSRVQSSRSR
eukprot:g15937.t1